MLRNALALGGFLQELDLGAQKAYFMGVTLDFHQVFGGVRVL